MIFRFFGLNNFEKNNICGLVLECDIQSALDKHDAGYLKMYQKPLKFCVMVIQFYYSLLFISIKCKIAYTFISC